MKDKLIIVGSIVIILIVILAAVIFVNYNKSTFTLEPKKDNSILVTVKNVKAEAGGFGYVTIKDGQKLEVKNSLTGKGTIDIQVSSEASEKPVLEKTFKGHGSHTYKLAQGEYTVRVTAKKGVTGTMTIKAK